MSQDNILHKDIVIWGTRVLGYTAYYYYKDKANIVCYIDNDKQKWGKRLNDIEICQPDILRNKNVTVVLAMRNGIETVKQQLCETYNIKSYVQFELCESIQSIVHDQSSYEDVPEDTCVVSFSGGLGNQMFQYAFLKSLEVCGKNVMADLEAYSGIGVMKFQLPEVFQNVNLKICTEEQKDSLIKKNVIKGKKAKKFVIYKEVNTYKTDKRKETDLSLLNITGGLITGTHQGYQFPGLVREILLNDFKFGMPYEAELEKIADMLLSENAIGVHIRRGDYIIGNNNWIYGDICTTEYYETAIAYMKERVFQCKFYFFSDDMEWVKTNYAMENAVYIEAGMFHNYKDWYDMLLMSLCKHNIIANSTFSWWGAWLNQNKEKIVIAPKRWTNQCDYKDIYPPEWVQV